MFSKKIIFIFTICVLSSLYKFDIKLPEDLTRVDVISGGDFKNVPIPWLWGYGFFDRIDGNWHSSNNHKLEIGVSNIYNHHWLQEGVERVAELSSTGNHSLQTEINLGKDKDGNPMKRELFLSFWYAQRITNSHTGHKMKVFIGDR